MSASVHTLSRESQPNNVRENRLLAALPWADYCRLRADLEPVRLRAGDLLGECGEPLRYVYFPQDAVASMLAYLEDGATVEVGMVGRGGVVGASDALGAHRAPYWITVQLGGAALRVRAEVFRQRVAASGALRQLMLRSERALVAQFCQRAACNCRHLILQRLCTWLLLLHDAAGADELPLTQDLIARRLGSRRASVTGAYNQLQKRQAVHYGRGHVQLVNRGVLEELACECYRTIKAEADDVLCG